MFGEKRTEMPHIIPVKDLKNTSEISDMWHKSDEPICITQNGYGHMVIMDMEVYEKIMRRLAVYRDVAVSEQQIETWHVRDARTALAELRKKHSL